MASFYEAEKKAFQPNAVLDSFALVGLLPWNPELILDNCRKQNPVAPQSDETGMIAELAQTFNMYSEIKHKEMEWKRSSVERASDPTTKISLRRNLPAEGCSTLRTFQCDRRPSSSDENSMSIATEPPAKRGKIMHVDRKSCASKWCQKSHLWSKKWVSCPKCHINFCE